MNIFMEENGLEDINEILEEGKPEIIYDVLVFLEELIYKGDN